MTVDFGDGTVETRTNLTGPVGFTHVYSREGGYTVTCPVLPELLTEGDTMEEAHANVRDAFEAVVELYAEEGRPLPATISLPASGEVVWSEALVGSP